MKRQSEIMTEGQEKPENSFPQEKLLTILKPIMHSFMPETDNK